MLYFKGLKNNQTEKDKLSVIIEKLSQIRDNEKSHLSDVALLLSLSAKDLESLSKDIFKLHKIEKDNHYLTPANLSPK